MRRKIQFDHLLNLSNGLVIVIDQNYKLCYVTIGIFNEDTKNFIAVKESFNWQKLVDNLSIVLINSQVFFKSIICNIL